MIQTLAKLIGLVLILNVIRYVVGGAIESVTIMEPMHRVMPRYPDVFDNEFSTSDFVISLCYNFMMWFTATWVFHLTHSVFKGAMWLRSLKVFGLMLLFFCSLAAVYMNHYTADVKPFYFWSMVDALILFPLIGLANGWLYPRFFRDARAGS